jgi:hypothetical protein
MTLMALNFTIGSLLGYFCGRYDGRAEMRRSFEEQRQAAQAIANLHQ